MIRRICLATMLAIALVGCARPTAAPSCGDGVDASNAVDAPIVAFLSKARALHHEATLHEDGGDLARAIGAMERLTGAQRPHPETRIPEIEEVLADAYARLGELRLRAGDLDGAARDAREGLAHVPEPTYFRGHLFEVQGLVEEARIARLTDAGQRAEAELARGRAVALFDEAVRVQDRVISLAVARDGGAEGGRR